MLGPVRQRVTVAKDAGGAAVFEAVVELGLRQAPRQRHEHDARPLGRPVEECGLDAVVEDDGQPFAALELEPRGDPRCATHAAPRTCSREAPRARRVPLAGGEQRQREIHPAASRIAATIGS